MESFEAAKVGSKGDLYAYFISNADELALDSALTLENDFAGEEFLPITAAVKMDRKTLEIVEGIQSVNTVLVPQTFWLDVDKYGHTYLSGGSLIGALDEASRTICDETFLLGLDDMGPLQMKLSSLDCSEAKCGALKGCDS